MRATSSTRSISRDRSRRQLGGRKSREPGEQGAGEQGRGCRTHLPLRPLRAPRSLLHVPQRREDPPHDGRLDLDAQDAFQLRKPQHDRFPRLRRRADIDHARSQLAAGHLQDQLGAAAAGPIDALRDRRGARNDTTNRCAGSVAGRWCGWRSDRSRPPRSARRGSLVDFRRRPAHHAADGHRHAGVGNHAHVRVQAIGLVVDGLDRLPGQRPADDDLRAVASFA